MGFHLPQPNWKQTAYRRNNHNDFSCEEQHVTNMRGVGIFFFQILASYFLKCYSDTDKKNTWPTYFTNETDIIILSHKGFIKNLTYTSHSIKFS